MEAVNKREKSDKYRGIMVKLTFVILDKLLIRQGNRLFMPWKEE